MDYEDDVDFCEQCDAVVPEGAPHDIEKHGGSKEAERLRNSFFHEGE